MTRAPAPAGTLTLPDGRTMVWNGHGDPDAPMVVWAVGAPSGRFTTRALDDVAVSAGVRLLVPDRPGVGLSSAQPGRRIADWAADVSAIADHLGVDRYAVCGGSGGGPYALACAAGGDPRVGAVAVLVGIGPLDTPEQRARLRGNRAIFELAADQGAEAVLPLIQALTQSPDPAAMDALIEAMSAPDREIVRSRPDLFEDLGDFGDAAADGGHGLAHDLWLFTQPWGFELADVRGHVEFYAADHDDNVPLPLVVDQFLAVADANLTVWPGSGHLSANVRLPEVLTDVRARLEASAREVLA